MKMLNNKKFMYAVSMVLILQLLLLYFHAYYRSLPRLIVLIVLTMLTLISSRAFTPLSFFRSLVVEIAFLPAIAYSIDLSEISVTVPDLNFFFQMLITFASLFRYFIPVFCIMSIAAYGIQEKIGIKKYIPFFVVMILAFVTAIFIPALFPITHFLFIYSAVIVIADICEGCLYKDRYSLISNLPYLFLYLTAIYRLRS